MLGTPDYIAPEQIRDAQSADIRADIYSLGCTLYHLLTGQPPFRGEFLWDVYEAHRSTQAAPLNLARPEVPVELAESVARMMAKEPGRRSQTPAQVAQALVPFFRNASQNTLPGTSAVTYAAQPARRTELPSVPTAPATNLPPASRPAASAPQRQTQPGWALEGLIDLREENSHVDMKTDGASARNATEGIKQGRTA